MCRRAVKKLLTHSINRVITFEVTKPIWPRYINVTDGRTDGRTTYDSNIARFALRASRGNKTYAHLLVESVVTRTVSSIDRVPHGWRNFQRRFFRQWNHVQPPCVIHVDSEREGARLVIAVFIATLRWQVCRSVLLLAVLYGCETWQHTGVTSVACSYFTQVSFMGNTLCINAKTAWVVR